MTQHPPLIFPTTEEGINSLIEDLQTSGEETEVSTPPGEGVKVTELGEGQRLVELDLGDGRTMIALTEEGPFGAEIVRSEVLDAAGGGARGPTQAELDIMRGELKVLEGRLKVDEGTLAEDIRSNKIQEELQFAGLGISRETLEETIRSALAQEEEATKDRALTAASNALTGYLRAAELSDARRLASLQLQRDFLPFAVDPEREFFGGGPEGSLATASQNFGLNFQPTAIQHQTVDTAGIAEIDPVAGANLQGAIEQVTLAGEV